LIEKLLEAKKLIEQVLRGLEKTFNKKGLSCFLALAIIILREISLL
jgi:hypothetical protein